MAIIGKVVELNLKPLFKPRIDRPPFREDIKSGKKKLKQILNDYMSMGRS